MWLECLFWHFKVKGSSSVFCYGWDANCRSESPSNLQQIGICGLNVRATTARKRPKWPVLVHIAIGAAAGNLQTHYLHSCSVGGIFIIFGCIHLVLPHTDICFSRKFMGRAESICLHLPNFCIHTSLFGILLISCTTCRCCVNPRNGGCRCKFRAFGCLLFVSLIASIVSIQNDMQASFTLWRFVCDICSYSKLFTLPNSWNTVFLNGFVILLSPRFFALTIHRFARKQGFLLIFDDFEKIEGRR